MKKTRGLFFSIVPAILILVVGFRMRPSGLEDRPYWCSGKVSPDLETSIVLLQEELREARRIVIARPDRLVLLDRNRKLRTYEHKYRSLWCNGEIMIHHLPLFYFEFRDAGGLLIRNSERMEDDLRTISFTFKRENGKKEVLVNSRVTLASSRAAQDLRAQINMASTVSTR